MNRNFRVLGIGLELACDRGSCGRISLKGVNVIWIWKDFPHKPQLQASSGPIYTENIKKALELPTSFPGSSLYLENFREEERGPWERGCFNVRVELSLFKCKFFTASKRNEGPSFSLAASEYMKDHIFELRRKIWWHDWSSQLYKT